jgi:hypothetical protein
MNSLDRRKFFGLAATASVPLFADIKFLAPLSRATAADPGFDPQLMDRPDDLSPLVRLIRDTPRERAIAVLATELRGGVSYQQFLGALFLSALSHGDPHQIAQVYSAHRVGSEVSVDQRLLPLFWVLDRVTLGFEQEPERSFRSIDLPSSVRYADIVDLRTAQSHFDSEASARAIIGIARSRGRRAAMLALWEFASRRTSSTLGHNPIMLANAWRTLESFGWRNAEPVLQYLAAIFAEHESDASYEPNLQLARKHASRLPASWAYGPANTSATLDIYAQIRRGDARATCQEICAQLQAGTTNAIDIWDAIHLTAADLLCRYKTGGNAIGGVLVHAVTTTDALRFGFACCDQDEVQLVLLLQAVAVLDDAFIVPAKRDGQLRDLNLIDLPIEPAEPAADVATIFGSLPRKDYLYEEQSSDERLGSDQACTTALGMLQDPRHMQVFLKTARSLMCVKASVDPHDFKYPAAAFDDAFVASPNWLPYLIASTVHALHGPKSVDSPALVRVRDALE